MNNRMVGAQGAGGANKAVRATAAGIAAAAQLVVGFFTMTAIGLISVPLWAIVLLAALWVAATVLLVRTWRTNPVASLAIPVVNALLLWGIVAAGGNWLGWSA